MGSKPFYVYIINVFTRHFLDIQSESLANKGGLISESFSICFKSPNMGAESFPWRAIHFKDKMLR
jgi:hypothetical protein